MTLNLTQADVGNVYTDIDGQLKLIAIAEEANEYSQAVFVRLDGTKEITTRSLGGLSGLDTTYDIIAEYKEPEVYEGWVAFGKNTYGQSFHGRILWRSKREAMNDIYDYFEVTDAIYIKHTIGEK